MVFLKNKTKNSNDEKLNYINIFINFVVREICLGFEILNSLNVVDVLPHNKNNLMTT